MVNYPTLFGAIGIIAILLLVIIFLIRMIRKKSRQKSSIPQDVLDDFNLAERKFKESKGEANPYTILWEIKKSKGGEQNDRRTTYTREIETTGRSQPEINGAELYPRSTERNDIQAGAPASPIRDNRSSEQPHKKTRRALFFGRKRRERY